MRSVTEDTTAVADVGEEAQTGYKMSLDVNIETTGPCRKHIRVKVPRQDLQHFHSEALKEVADSAAVPGFRPGRVPAALVERRFKKELSDQVRQQVLMQSLEQLAEEHKLDPINEPDFDVESLVIPDDGDFEYEFDVEVRPDFDLPTYSGLKIERPIRDVTEADVDGYLEKFLGQYGTLVDVETPAAKGDFVNVTMAFTHGDKLLRKIENIPVQLKSIVGFQDTQLTGFDELLVGATPETVKTTTVVVASEAEQVEMRGETVAVEIRVNKIQQVRKPDLNSELLARIGFDTEEDLRSEIRRMLERQVQFEQRQATRRQVLAKITESADWDLPEELVRKQVENALRREVLEMKQSGFTTDQIRARENELRQKSISTTRQALKEHFVLDRIATQENVEVAPHDVEAEIHMMAIQQGESPRRVRARLQKSGVIENLEAQIRERKAVDVILKTAEFVDVPAPAPAEDNVASIPLSVCGISAVTTGGSEHDHDHDHDHGHDHDHDAT